MGEWIVRHRAPAIITAKYCFETIAGQKTPYLVGVMGTPGLMLRCNTAREKVSMHLFVIALIAIDLCLLNTKISEQKLAPRQYRFHVRSL